MVSAVPLSVVVVPIVGGIRSDQLLASLESPGLLPPGAEVLFVGPSRPQGRNVEWIDVPEDTPVPKRRSLGAARAEGEVIAFVEDTVRLDSGWGDAVIGLHSMHPSAAGIGGTLRISRDLLPRDAAFALLDYGSFLRQVEASEEADALPGNVLSFKRAALAEHGDSIREAELIPRLAKSGRGSRLESSMGATCIDADPRGSRLANRFHHGRLYAGNRFASGAMAQRLLRAATFPVLAIVLTFRAARAAHAEDLPRIPATLAYALIMSAAWSSGEAVGYLFGPGESERHWK